MKPHKIIAVILPLLLLAACAGQGPLVDNSDPYEEMNRKMYAFNDSLDRNFFQPLARGYVKVTPSPVRMGVGNFFSNLSYLNVVLNSFLQGKMEQGGSASLRFLLNSTLGVAGLFDIASPVFPKYDEDFGQTLAHWGMVQGPFLTLPLFGPNTTRNTSNFASSTLTNPLTYAGGTVLLPIYLLNAVNTRANLLDASGLRDESALNPYVFTREAYLQQRRFLIHDGQLPIDEELHALLPPADELDSMDSIEEQDAAQEGTLRIE